eukprot:3223064-Prymnesium_polylepis.1
MERENQAVSKAYDKDPFVNLVKVLRSGGLAMRRNARNARPRPAQLAARRLPCGSHRRRRARRAAVTRAAPRLHPHAWQGTESLRR